MAAPSPPSQTTSSGVGLVLVLGGALVLGAHVAAAALAWRAGYYAPRIGPPLWDPDGALLAVRAAVALGAVAVVALAVRRRGRPALVLALALVVVGPAALGPVYTPADGYDWTRQIVAAGALDGPAGRVAGLGWAGGAAVGLGLLSALTAARRREPSSAHGTATWGSAEGLLEPKTGLVLGREDSHVPEVGHAVPEDGTTRGRVRAGDLLRHDGPGHVLTVAPTRAGKGVGAVIPNLLDHPGPVVVTDPKGENLALTARYRADVLGHRVVALDPFRLAPDDLFDRADDRNRGTVTRGALNPLDFIDEDSPHLQGDAALVAEMLVVGDEGGGDNRFFAEEGKALLAGLVTYVACRKRKEARSLLTVRALLTQDRDGLEALVRKMQGDPDFDLVRRAGNRIDQKHERERSSVVSTAQSHTHFLDSAFMADVLGPSTFDPAALRPGSGTDGDPRPLSLYLLLPPDQLDVFARWLRIVVATTITSVAKLGPVAGPAPPADRRALYLLDEFAQLGPMPPVRRAVSLMAGYGVQVWTFLQDLSQLRLLYPKSWETFVANADVVQAFGTTDQGTAEYLSKSAGVATVFHHSESASRNRGKHTSRTAGAGASETSRPVVTADELRRLDAGDQVLIPRGSKPVRARRIAYYNDPTFKGRLKRAARARAKRAKQADPRSGRRSSTAA